MRTRFTWSMGSVSMCAWQSMPEALFLPLAFIVSTSSITSSNSPTTDSIAVSLQHAAKFNRDDDSASWIVVAVFVRRLVDHGTDVVVSWNRPVTSSDEGKTSAMVIDNAEDATRVWLEDTPAVAQFQRMIDSLTVVDASIFG